MDYNQSHCSRPSKIFPDCLIISREKCKNIVNKFTRYYIIEKIIKNSILGIKNSIEHCSLKIWLVLERGTAVPQTRTIN